MKGPASGDSALIDEFKAFHVWLNRFVRTLATAPSSDLAPAGKGHDPDAVRTELHHTINSMAHTSNGRRSSDNGRDTRYLMAAFADELLIATSWEHQHCWINFLVEEKLFGTRHAGDQVLDQIETLLRADDPERRELALPYLFALALGFRGRAAAGEQGDQLLAALRTRLFRHATQGEPDPAFGSAPDSLDGNQARRVMGAAYHAIKSGAGPALLPDPRRWIGWFAVAVLAMLVAAWLVWSAHTRELHEHFDVRAALPTASGVSAGGARERLP